MQVTYMYAILDVNGQVAYVGKSNNPWQRFHGHMNSPNNEQLRGLIKVKGRHYFSLLVLEKVFFPIPRAWVKREKFWINKFREEGHPLCNKNNGGGGPTEISEKERARRSEAQSGINSPNYGRAGKDHPCYGRHQTDAAKVAIAEAASKLYPTFVNIVTGDMIPAGKHLKKMCKVHGLDYQKMWALMKGCRKGTKDGWKVEGTDSKEVQLNGGGRFPAFFNSSTKEFIPAGSNLKKMCRGRKLSYPVMWYLKDSEAKQSRDGWRLATASEIVDCGAIFP